MQKAGTNQHAFYNWKILAWIPNHEAMKWMTCIALIVAFMAESLKAQEYSIRGEIRDADSEEPIPFARFQILPAGTSGFVADLNGNFSHQATERKLEVMVSSIGYEKKRVELTAESSNLIQLQPVPISTSDVVITYVDHERVLLQKVLDAIPENYPVQNERITGQVIEQLASDSLYQELIYSAEAMIEADKLPYSKRSKYSTVRILDGEVKFQKQGRSPSIQIMAGAHNVHRFDVVASREPPLDNIQSKKYRFQLMDTTRYMGEDLFKMGFETPEYNGTLYIQDSTYALVKAEYKIKEEKVQGFALSGGSTRLFLNFTTEYFKADSCFRLSFINYQTGFSDVSIVSDDRVYLNNFFYLSRHNPSETLIPYNEQNNFTDRLVMELPQDTSEQVQGMGFRKIFKNLSSSFGVGILRYMPNSETSALYASGLDSRLRSQVHKIVTYTQLKYHLNKAWGIQYAGGGSIGFNRNIASHSLMIVREQPMTKNQKWLFEIGTGANYLKADIETGEGLPFGALLQNSTLREETAQIIEQNRQFNLLATLQFKYRASTRLHVILGGYLPLNVIHQLDIQAGQEDERVLLYQRNFRNRFRPDYHQLNLGVQFYL